MSKNAMSTPMGEVYTPVRVHGPHGSVELERVLVDTGAIHSMIDRTIADRLGITTERRTRFAVVGGTIEFPVSLALLEIEGQSFRVPVILGDQNLVGLTTLETLGFAVDPLDRKLVPKPGVLYPMIA
jgi:predicted aspartyl protease